jgi:WD40 repeat protein
VFVYNDSQDKILIINSQTNKVIKTIDIQLGFVNSIINISNNRFASCSDKGTIRIWDMKEYNCLTSYSADFVAIKTLLFVEKRNLLISGSLSLKFWDVNYTPPQRVHTINDVDFVYCLLLLPGRYFASGSKHGHIKIWDLDNFRCVNKFRQPKGDVHFIILVKDYRIITSSSIEIGIWDY